MTTTTPRIPAAYLAIRAKARCGDDTAFRPALEAAMRAVNGRADAFTLTASDAVDAAVDAEAAMARSGITKEHRSGIIVTVTSAGPAARAYKYAARGTQITLRRNSAGHWDLTSVTRVEVHPKQTRRTTIAISAAAADDVRRHAMHGYVIAEA